MTKPGGVPEQIGRYEILSELGRGAMGHVYLALDPNIQRKVALKVFLPLLKVEAQEELELQQRFIFEARAAGRLKHPGIVLVFDADTDPQTGLSFIAMEWVDGPSLQDLLTDSGSLPIKKAVSSVEQVAIALDTAHREGLVHRDVKPANILLDSEGLAKVTDFGIAKLASMSITGTGWIPGTPFYMSPEQVRNDAVDGRSDLYSLGVVLYQCLTGQVPFHGNSLASMTYMILEVDPRPPRWLNPYIPETLEGVIQRAMEKSPENRYQTGIEFAEALRQCAPVAAPEGELQKAAAVTTSPRPFGEAGGAGAPPALRPETVARVRPADRPEASASRVGRGDGSATPAEEVSAPRRKPWPRSPKRPRYALAAALSLLLLVLVVPPTLRSWRTESPASPGGPPPPEIATLPQPDDEPVALASLGPVYASESTAMGVFEPFENALAASAGLGPVAQSDGPTREVGEPLFVDDTRATSSGPEAMAVLQSPPAAPQTGGVSDSAGPPSAQASEAFDAAVTSKAAPESSRPSSPAADPAPTQAAKAAPAAPRAAPRPRSATRSVPAKTARQPAQPAMAQLEVLFRNRLKDADLSVWIDERKVWQQNMTGPKNIFKKAFGKDVWTTLPVRAGKRVIDIRITGSEGKIDLVKRTEAVFSRGEIKRLRVVLFPRKTLKLEWKKRSRS